MQISRRQWLAGAAAGAAGLAMNETAEASVAKSDFGWVKFGMCDWSMQLQEPATLAMAAEIGLDGVEVDLGRPETGLHMRDTDRQRAYMAAMRDTGLEIPSMAMVAINIAPLMSEPVAALWVADAIETTKAMGGHVLLTPFFADGELKEGNTQDISRVVDALIELAPRAEKAGVILGIESYLSAETHMKIMDEVKSPALQVYYDCKNATDAGYDAVKDIRMLGKERICRVHFKEWPYLESPEAKVDWPGVVEALAEIRYSGWAVLETGSPSKNVIADAKKNLAYLKKLFGVTP